MSPRSVFVPLAVATALGVSACGGGSEGSSKPAVNSSGVASSTPSAATTTTTPTTPPFATTCVVSTSAISKDSIDSSAYALDQNPTISVKVDAPQFSGKAIPYIGCSTARELVQFVLEGGTGESAFTCEPDSAQNLPERQNPDGSKNPQEVEVCSYKSTDLGQITYTFPVVNAS